MLAHIRRLFAYDRWANREVLHSFQSAAQVPASALKRFSHVLSAEQLWLERLTGQPQTSPVWPDFSLPQVEARSRELSQLWRNYLSGVGEADLSRICHYINSKGEKWSSRTEDILVHLIMHSAYHRGQIAGDMRAAGFTPAYTDFIHAARQELLD